MIVHGHVFMNGHRVTVPGYIVLRDEEPSIEYAPASPFTDEMHPMRISAEQAAANQAARAVAAKAEVPEAAAEDDEEPIPEEE
jgi:small subunit ribosomal protein S4